jgi:uncharacterized repeat protein (TIGR01451 family)
VTRFWSEKDDLVRLEQALRAQRAEPTTAFSRSIERRLNPHRGWVRPRVRYALVAALSALVVVGGASAHMFAAATSGATSAVHIVQRLAGEKVTHAAHVTAAAATPARDQYAPFVPPANPAISITIDPASQTVDSARSTASARNTAGTASFTIKIKNTGNVKLTSVRVTDLLAPDCARSVGSLVAGGSSSYACTRAHVTRSFTNVAIVTGHDSSAKVKTVSDTGHAQIIFSGPFAPPGSARIGIAISPKVQRLTTKVTVTKKADGTSMTKSVFAAAHFKITVKNKGTVTLTAVTVSDPHASACSRSFAKLLPGASRSYSCSKPAVGRAFTDVAIASGKPPTGARVQATAAAGVRVKSKTTTVGPAHFTG